VDVQRHWPASPRRRKRRRSGLSDHHGDGAEGPARIDDPDCSIDGWRLVQADPLLAARVVAVANSVIYNRSGRAHADVKSAVSRIGFNTLRVLAAAVVVRQMEGMARHPGASQAGPALWEHTAHVAALAQVIARRVTHVNPDTAFFAGIIHEVGGFYLIARAGDYPGLLDSPNGSLLAWDEGGAAAVGRAVLKRLARRRRGCEAIEGMWAGLPGHAAAIPGRHPAAGRPAGADRVALVAACRQRTRRHRSRYRCRAGRPNPEQHPRRIGGSKSSR
jgi:hypothetical protein